MESLTDDQKICVDCKTSKTPLWRSGPSGPKSLCNACGIRFRKKKSLSSSSGSGSDKKKEKQLTLTLTSTSSSSSSSSCSTIGEDDCCDLRKKSSIKVVKEVVLLRSGMKKVRIRRNDYKKLGEVEQAAFLLMSLSCGSCVFA